VNFADLLSVILLLIAAGLTVLAGLPLLRRWQRERERGARRDGAVHDPAGETAGGYRADVAMEERGHPARPDQHWLADDHHHPHEDQDEQMRNRPADEQHHRRSHLGGSARPRPAEEPDVRHAPAVGSNGYPYGGFDDVDDALNASETNGHYEHAGYEHAGYEHAGEPNGHYEQAGEPDDARRAAHFDWKVAAQYERARAARNASMSSFEPPSLPDDGPGTFTEEIPAIHAADGQRRHPAVQPDPDMGTPRFGQQRANMQGEPQGSFADPWGPETAVHAPPAFEFDEQHFDEQRYDQRYEQPYDQRGPEPQGFDQPVPGYGAPDDQGGLDDLSPPPHMRWRPDPEPDAGLIDETPFGVPPAPHGPGVNGPAGPHGSRPAFATTFRVQPAVEEPVPVHIAEPTPLADPADAFAVDHPDMGPQPPGWTEDEAPNGYATEPAPSFSDVYAPPPAPPYQARHFDEPVAPPVFDDLAGQGGTTPGTGIASAFETPSFETPSTAQPFDEPAPARPPLPDITPLLAEDEVAELRTRWNAIKGTFPDDPITSVQEASKLVGECTKVFERRLGVDPGNDDVSTEDLRLALQRYLAFFERLLSS
jgi:hypothetical protein